MSPVRRAVERPVTAAAAGGAMARWDGARLGAVDVGAEAIKN